MTHDAIPDISDDAVRRVTGRSWSEWRIWLDRQGAADRSHREIVALVAGGGGVDSGWWQQAVANGYEKLVGRRVLGQTQDGGFQVGVSKTIHASPDAIWKQLTSSRGLRAWLGEKPPRALRENARYTLGDGASGEIRIVKPGRQLRLTWQPAGWERPSTIQVRVTPKGEGRAVLSFHQEQLPDAEARVERRAWFRSAAAELVADLDG
jgi:uncharacterized protein YndB with AHSA1/START domain